MRIIFDFLYLVAAIIISPVIVYRMAKYKRYRVGWGERLGKIARKDPSKKCIWLHAVSVGEVNAARTLVKELEDKFGKARTGSRTGFEIVISTTTDTGMERASALYGSGHTVFYFPLDFSWIMRRAFGAIRPAICLLMEQEVWPNFVQTAAKLNVPVIVVNGRISDKGFSKFRRIKPIARKIFQNVTLILAQTEQYAERFKEIGCPADKIIVTGSLKYDTAQITDKVEGADELAGQLFGKIENRKSKIENHLWVAGATGPGEEQIILNVYKNLKRQDQFNNLLLVIVPRKPERFDEVAQLIKQAGFDLIRYSKIKEGSGQTKEKPSIDAVILGDTMGDLRKFYSLATVIFVGRSLVPMGGSDMAEAAALGKPTIFGPYTSNFEQTVDALLKDEGAIMVKNQQELLEAVDKCLCQPEFAQRIARNGQEVIRKNQGATTRTIAQIAKFLTPHLKRIS